MPVKNKKSKKPLVIAVTISAAVIVVAAVAVLTFGGALKRMQPEVYVARILTNAVSQLSATVKTPDIGWLYDLLEGGSEQSLAISPQDVSGSAVGSLDPNVISIAQALALSIDLQRPASADGIHANLGISALGMPLAGMEAYLTPDALSVNIPALYDYYISANPQTLCSDWNGSILGNYSIFIIDDGQFNGVYQKLFSKFQQPKKVDFANADAFTALKDGVEIEYGGKQSVQTVAGLKDGEEYRITLKKDSVNQYFDSVGRQIKDALQSYDTSGNLSSTYDSLEEAVTEADITIYLEVYKNTLYSLRIYTGETVVGGNPFGTTINFLGEGNPFDKIEGVVEPNGESPFHDITGGNHVCEFTLDNTTENESKLDAFIRDTSNGKTYSVSFSNNGGENQLTFSIHDDKSDTDDFIFSADVSWDNTSLMDNFTLSADAASYAGTPISASLNVSGTLTVDGTAKRIIADFDNFHAVVDNADGSAFIDALASVQYSAKPFDGSAALDGTDTKNLTDLTNSDLTDMLNKLLADPNLGALVSAFLMQ